MPFNIIQQRIRDFVAHPLPQALLILTLLWFLFFWRIFAPVAEDRVIFNQEGDFILHFYAPIAYQVERFWEGELPLWNPYNYGGEPSAANIQNGSFYPLRYLSALVAGRDNYTFQAYQTETAFHYWLASWWMFLFLWLNFRRRWLALIGGVLFAYSGYMTSYPMLQASTVATEAWFPLALLGVTLSITREKWRWWGTVIAAISVSLMLLAVRPQAAFYLISVTMLYLLFLGWQGKISLFGILWRGFVIGAVGAGLAMIQLLPMAELLTYSYRYGVYGFLDKGSGFALAELRGLLYPSFYQQWSPLYIGVVGFLLAIGAVVRAKNAAVRFWLLIGGGALLLSFGANTVAFDFVYNFIPGFDLFRNQERLVSLLIFALIMLAMHGLQAFSEEVHAKILRRLSYGYAALWGLIFLLVSIAQSLNPQQSELWEAANVFGFVALVALLFALWNHFAQPKTHLAGALLLVLIVLDLFSVGSRSVNFVPDTQQNRIALDEVLQPLSDIPADEVFWRVDGAAGLQGRGILFDIPDIYGLGGISLATPEELYSLPVDRLWEIFAVRYVTVSDALPQGASLELLGYGRNYDGEEYQLLELNDPRPLAHLVYDYLIALDNPFFAREMMADSQVDLREMAITTQPLPFDLPVERPENSAVTDVQIHSPEHLIMAVSTSENALLTVSLVKYPGWRVTVNGESVGIVDTYAGLIGVP
ncbi:MAG: hypothetical protein KC496_19410, partial [Anaerolineae bacterium]|nr:hypothetical protein [Anaerolineae bacterium]